MNKLIIVIKYQEHLHFIKIHIIHYKRSHQYYKLKYAYEDFSS